MKTQCSKSWTDVNIDFKNRLVRHCCKSLPYTLPDSYTTDYFNNSQLIQDRRSATLQGQQHHDCSYCWRDYNSGIGAYRDWMNRWSDSEFNDAQSSEPKTNYIDIELDNTCDLSCIYCSSVCSSKIAQEEGTVNINNSRDYDIEQFKKWFETIAKTTKNEVVVNFLGGEPTASKLFYELLEYIQDITSQHVDFKLRVEICTNCNSKPHLMDKIIKALDNSNVEWAVSISNESVGGTSELIRYGLNWERFTENFCKYIKHPKVTYITLAPTVNVFNLKSFADYIEWVHVVMATYAPEKNFGWVGSHVTWPDELDIKYLPPSYKCYIIAAKEQFEQYKNNPRLNNYNRFQKFLNEMEIRISSHYREDFKEHLQQFVNKKNKVKHTSSLQRLIGDLNE